MSKRQYNLSIVIAGFITAIVGMAIIIAFLLGTISKLKAESENWKSLYEMTSYEQPQFVKGEILYPDYALSDTVVVTEDFTIPDSCVTDSQLYEYVMSKTKIIRNIKPNSKWEE